MRPMRIAHIVPPTDFRKSEVTLFNLFAADHPTIVKQLERDDVVVFISKTRRIIRFVHAVLQFGEETKWKAVRCVQHRILNGTWDPRRLRMYVEEAGLQVINLKRYEEEYERLEKEAA